MSYEFACKDAGAACGATFKAETQEELLNEIADHLHKKHNVQVVSKTLQKYALSIAKER